MGIAKGKVVKTKPCTCREQVQKKLAEFNTCLAPSMIMNFKTGKMKLGLLIETEKIDPKKRGKKKNVLATYCPFCGKKLDT